MKEQKLSATQEAFLAAYRLKGTILHACEGICERITHYRWLKSIPEYQERFLMAKEEFAERLLDHVMALTFEGEDIEIWNKNGPVMKDGKVLVRKKKNHRFVGQLLKIHFPQHREPNKKQLQEIVVQVLQAFGIATQPKPNSQDSNLDVTECYSERHVASMKSTDIARPPSMTPPQPPIGPCKVLGRRLKFNMAAA